MRSCGIVPALLSRFVPPWLLASTLGGLLSLLVQGAAQGRHEAVLPHQKVGADGALQILIPAGSFVMGSTDGQADEQPPHLVILPAYYLDAYEITVARYARFLKGVNAERPLSWGDATSGPHNDKPVVGVDWFDAKEYCEWVGRRLPTEAEWEKAARGTDRRRYPWGDDPPTPARATFNRPAWRGYVTLSDVGAHLDGRSPYGVYDLAGNVWEWVADHYDQHYYAESPRESPQGPATGALRVLRGGAWSNEAAALRASNRGGYPPTAHRSDFGFRCAADAAP